jgi:hypothetical protein
MPPGGAGAFRFTLFDVVETPPTTDAGDRMTESSATGLTVRMAVLRTPLYVAEIVTGVVAETSDVVIVKIDDTLVPAAYPSHEHQQPTKELSRLMSDL